jgi:two-component system, NarL family, invasion response regulator UvrY
MGMTRILIVDDHELVRRGLKQVLLEEFPDVEFGEATSAKDALHFLTRLDWDLVLLDINIPGRSGLEVLEEAHRARPKLPVLVLSAYSEEEFAVRSIQLGASGYLMKSNASDELVAAARKVLSGGKFVTASLAERLASILGGDIRRTPHESLSARELQVVRLVASGKTLKEIGTQLSLSEKTIATYRARIAQKLGLSSNVEITRYAMQNRLVE